MRIKDYGLTVKEFILVLAVVVILAALLVATFFNVSQSAKESRALLEVETGWNHYLTQANAIVSARKTYILYRNNNWETAFILKDGAIEGQATENEIASLKKNGFIDPALCGYEYNADTQDILCHFNMNPIENTTEEINILFR